MVDHLLLCLHFCCGWTAAPRPTAGCNWWQTLNWRRAGLERCDQTWPQLFDLCGVFSEFCHLHGTQEIRTALAGLQNSSFGCEGRR